MDEDKRLSYFFLGLGIGVAVGILFAPKAGDETRGMIRSKAGEGADYLKRRSEDVRTTANDALERSKSAVQRQKEQLAAAVEAGKQAYRDTVGKPGSAPELSES